MIGAVDECTGGSTQTSGIDDRLAEQNRAGRRKPARRAAKLTRRVTMTDIAKAAGCSQATVSFVLNRTTGVKISAETRNRVIEAARELGYSAPVFAHMEAEPAEAADGVSAIGFVVDQLATSPEAVVAIEGARQASWEAGDVLLVAQTLGDALMEPRTLRALSRQGLAGLIYMTIFTRKIETPAVLRDLDVPVVLLNCWTADGAFPAVVPDEVRGGEAATNHLLELGHTRIATITGEPWMDAAQDRLKGYKRALSGAGLGFDPQIVVQGNWTPSAGYEGTRQLLALPEPPTAIFCQNDRMVIGCYEALKEAGLRVPDDISVVGYDDEEIARHLHPQLTTFVLPHRAMGQWAIEQLRAGVDGRERHAVTKLECPQVVRFSAGTSPRR